MSENETVARMLRMALSPMWIADGLPIESESQRSIKWRSGRHRTIPPGASRGGLEQFDRGFFVARKIFVGS
jgi:hypothetical protein